MQVMPWSIELINNKYFILIFPFIITLRWGEGGADGAAFILIWNEGSYSPYPILYRSNLVYIGSKHSTHHFCAEYIEAVAIFQLSPGVLMNCVSLIRIICILCHCIPGGPLTLVNHKKTVWQRTNRNRSRNSHHGNWFIKIVVRHRGRK